MRNTFAQIRCAAWFGFCAVVLATTTVGSASAGLLDLYHLGEADPGAVAGNPGNNPTIDSGPDAKNLTPAGSPTYSSNAAPGSTLSMAFHGSDSYSYINGGNPSVVTTLTNDVGISAWVYPTQNNVTNEIAYNGNGGSNGWGLFQVGPGNGFTNAPGFATVIGLLGGVTYGPSASIPLNQWSYVTQLLVGGQDKLYVNNVLVQSVPGVANTPISSATSSFSIGAGFQGNIDEVRVITPEPSSVVLCGLGAVGLLVAARRRRKI